MRKKLVSIFCLLITLTLLFSACVRDSGTGREIGELTGESSTQEQAFESEDPNVNPPGKLPVCKEKIKMSVGIFQAQGINEYDDNEFTKWLEEQTNIDFEFEAFPNQEAKQQLQIMVASGIDLPETLLGFVFTDMELYNYGQEGILIPLNKYYENYGYWSNIMFETAANNKLKQFLTSADGNMYVVPKYTEASANEWSCRAWVNKVWLETLGLQMPTTTDDFYNVLKAFKTGDPNGNMEADEIPYSGSASGWRRKPYDYLINAFIYNDTINRFLVNNGVVDVAYTKTEWRDALAYMNKLYQEGLFDANSLTQTGNQLNQAVKGGEKSIPTIGAYAAGGPILPFQDHSIYDLVALPPLKGPNGVQWAAYFPAMPQHNFVITKYCKNPLAAFRWADFMLSEEASLRSRWGVPGTHWLDPEPGDKGLFEDSLGIKAVLKPVQPDPDNPELFMNIHWGEANPSYRPYVISDGNVWSGDPFSADPIIGDSVRYYIGKRPEEIVYNLIYKPEEADEIKDLQNNINNYVNQCIVKFISGEMRIESEWEIYLNELDKMGLARYLEICRSVYDRMNK